MVRAGKWLRSFLAGRKEKSQENKKDDEASLWLQLPPPPPPPTSPKESFRKKKNVNQLARRHSISAPVYSGRAAGRKTRFIPMEDIAAIKIQSSFRSYLARKALRALKGVVKLQAMARGLLARKQAAASLRSLPDLVAAQTRALAQRAQVVEAAHEMPWRESFLRKMMVEFKSQQLHGVQKNTETEQGQLKAIPGLWKSNNLPTHSETKENRVSIYQKAPPSPSNLTDTSSGANSARFEEPPFAAAKGSAASHKPRRTSSSEDLAMQEGNYQASHESALCPNYMANTESWRAKARSQTAPRQRPESVEQKQPGRRRAFEGRSLSRVESSKEQYSWCDELDRSATTKAGYCRFVVA